MGVKVSNLPQGTIIADDDLIYAVIGGVSVKMLKSDFEASLNSVGEDGHISGVIKWKTGLTFVSVELYWRKNNVIYYSNRVERTSTAADGTHPRIDLFYGDDSGDWGIIAGTPAVTPVKPSATDTDTQVEVSFTLILATATTPDDFENITTYDEFGTIVGGETDVTLSANGTLNSTEQAYNGTKSIKFTSSAISYLANFTFATSRNMSDFVSLSFWVYLETVGDNSFWIRFSDLTGADVIGLRIVVDNGVYGFDSTLLNTWQNIIIPKSDFNVGDLDYGQLDIHPRLSNSTSFIDLVEVQEGNNEIIPSNICARDVQVDTDNFDNNLSSADDTVQKALETLDDIKDLLVENATVTGTYDLDYDYDTWLLTFTGAVTFTESNLPTSGTNTKVITIHVLDPDGNALTFPANWSDNVTGTFDSTAGVFNTIVVEFIKTGVYKVGISQED